MIFDRSKNLIRFYGRRKGRSLSETNQLALQEGAKYLIKKSDFSKNSKLILEDLVEFKPTKIILEIGFGTGLNAFLTALESGQQDVEIHYEGVEAYPVEADELSQLNYAARIAANQQHLFDSLHKLSWEELHSITSNFSLKKRQQFFSELSDENSFDLIYFDAFGARVQPELWTESIFKSMYRALKNKGVLVTYSAKGSVRRAMQTAGFLVERLEGPPGKREMLRATKSSKIC